MRHPRLTTVMGVARAVLATVGPVTAAEVLVEEFGFDATFQALALLPGDGARLAFAEVWTQLLIAPLDAQLPHAGRADGDERSPGRVHG